MPQKPNKAPEPTPLAVTPPACAGVAPSVAVAHLRRSAKQEMKTLAACLLSSLVAALVVAICSGAGNYFGGSFSTENDDVLRLLDLMFFVFLYALGVAVVIGVPFHLVSKMILKERGLCYAIAGSLAAIAFIIAPLVESRGANPALLKLALILAVAGLLAGWTFFRVSRT